MRRASLAPGDRLPSVRALAAALGVSPTTVAAAVRELARRGVVVTRPRAGVSVAPRPPVAVFRPPAVPAGLRDLASGNPDPALLPDLRPRLEALDPPARLYGQEPVLPELAAAIRLELAGIGLPAAHVTLTSGALDGVERVLAAHLRPGDRVAVEDPAYPSTLDLLRALGLVPVPVSIDGRGMRPGALAAALAAGVAAVLVTPRGQNPTGAALDAERAGELCQVLGRRPELLAVEDDHLGPVAGAPVHTTLAGRPRWAFVRSFAKSLGPDLRVAFVAGDEETVARVAGRHALGPGWVSTLLQRLVAELAASAETGRVLARAAEVYSRRREGLLGSLAARGFPAEGQTGFNVWVPVPDEAAALHGLADAGYAVMPGALYRLASPPGIRITTATLEPEEAERVAGALARALRPASRTRPG